MSQPYQTYLRTGAVFQFTAIATFLLRWWFYRPQSNYVLVGALTLAGLLLFLYCLHVLYFKKNALNTLITTGPFKYTRHPMYTAFVLMDLPTFFAPITPGLISSAVIFYGALVMAGWWQEKETLARFGNAAQQYYARTPRLFFLYPLRLLYYKDI